MPELEKYLQQLTDEGFAIIPEMLPAAEIERTKVAIDEVYEAEREIVQVETSLGAVSAKVKQLGGTNVAVSPEYEDCRRIAVERGMPLQEVYRIVQREAGQTLLES